MVKFSILTATHNTEKYVIEAIQSIINQTYPEWEMIIVDDCSTDETYQKTIEYSKNSDRIKIYRNEKRLYCSDTYQKALELASGEICGVLDGDDVLVPNAIERIVGLYNKYNKLGFIYTQSWWCNDNLVPRRKGLSRLPEKGQLLFMGMRQKHAYSHWRTFKTKLRERRNPIFEKGLKCSVDKSLGYVLEELAPGGFLDECLYNYRYHRDNMSHKTAQRPVWKAVVQKAMKRRRNNKIIPKGIIKVG
jgi:glycosyltransferase involved in cell wall biosynthesis